MQLKVSPTETREEDSQQVICDTSKPSPGSEGIKQHERKMKTKDTDVNETTQQSRGSEPQWSKNGAQEKVPDKASNQMRLVKIASISRKTPTGRRKKRYQTGTDLQDLARISKGEISSIYFIMLVMLGESRMVIIKEAAISILSPTIIHNYY